MNRAAELNTTPNGVFGIKMHYNQYEEHMLQRGIDANFWNAPIKWVRITRDNDNKVLHERNIMLTVMTSDVPSWPEADRLEIRDMGSGFWRVVVRFGFMDIADVPNALKLGAAKGLAIEIFDTSFFLSREAIRPSIRPGMPLWRETLFAWMSRNATSAMDFFKLPPDRVVEVGTTVEI